VSVPFRGRPRTVLRKTDNDEIIITVDVFALHPWMLKCIRWTGIGCTAATIGLTGYGLAINSDPTWLNVLAAVGISALTYPTWRYGLGYLFQFHVPVRFTPNQISFKRWFTWKHFERRHPHSFVVRFHDKQPKEKDRIDFLNKKRLARFWWFRRQPVFGDSYHIVLEYFGERQDVITVYGAKTADKIQARLKACDDIIEAETHGDGGITLSPEKDWGAAVGTI